VVIYAINFEFGSRVPGERTAFLADRALACSKSLVFQSYEFRMNR